MTDGIAGSLGLPPGGVQLILWGREQLLAREHRGLLGYSTEEVILAAGSGASAFTAAV